MNRKLIVLLAALTLVLTACAVSDAAEPGGTADGIQVHGHWTIDIYNEDGTLDQHREFENGLTSTGASFLSLVLAQQISVGTWWIELAGGITSELPCENSVGGASACVLTEPGQGPAGPEVSDNLQKTATEGVLTLSGSITAARTGSIDRAETRIGSCGPDVSPDLCSEILRFEATNPSFTHRSGFGPFNVEAGQQILLTLEISFT